MSVQTEQPAKDRGLYLPFLAPVYERLDPLAFLALRVATGLLLVPHGAQKLFGWFGGGGIAGTAGWLESVGYQAPTVLALLIGLVDTFGKVWLPEASGVLVYVLMALILLWKPSGLFKAGG